MKIKNLLLLFAGAMLMLSSCGQKMTGNAKLKSETDTLSYAIGSNMASSLKRSSIDEINYDLFIQAMKDRFEDNKLKLSDDEIRSFLQRYTIKLQAKQAKIRQEKAAKNLEEGRKFLEENKKKDGIKVTDSGLQYEIIKEGTGKSPSLTDTVVCNYTGTLIDGTEFQSTKDKKPFVTSLNRVFPGWQEGLQLMKEGAKYKFYIPTELAYGQRPPRGIEPNMPLIFEVELLEVIPGPKGGK